ncbi:MAG TPA: hypothetical protein PLY87_28275 [Planctomycetaceae bacterium]|nr:hypothetical protein [Planctomycetaceae bacterium]
MSKTEGGGSGSPDCSPVVRLAYRLDAEDIAHLLLGGDVIVVGSAFRLVLACDGIPMRDHCIAGLKGCGARVGCVREKIFDAEDDGT